MQLMSTASVGGSYPHLSAKRPGILALRCTVLRYAEDLDSEDGEVSVLVWPSRSLLHITVSTLPEHTYRTSAELPVILQTQIQSAHAHTSLPGLAWPSLQLDQLIYRCHHCEIDYVMQPVC
ncbi:hypothetical protein CBL_04711 [Carabus blaptoides fortunei]